ncbi:MAG: DNA methyltransferase [Ignavibacterium sp.]|uniref:type I restriction-modification system subunit M n=1 Tax=Ignavibacterium sp. TaxID=2651167 RepID=UPI0021DDA53C|nr:type I restriction-modification system subunit M [Ignavibacterium sp.]BDQ02088.1 MAG: DNA methyltransferase [Ignavibacterium sp.]GIV46237.1 MAG: DNA methyltransferase [Ignavibacterium sp.]
MSNNNNSKSLESWIWDAACAIRGAQDAPKYKDFILPLIFVKRLCDVFDDEVQKITDKIGDKKRVLKLIEKDRKLTRFYIPFRPENIDDPTWSVIRKLSTNIGEELTNKLRDIARENPRLQGIIDRVDFNATTHGQRDIDDDKLSNLIEEISKKRLGLKDVEPDIIGRSYEYLIRKFAEGGGQSAGEFYTSKEVGMIIARILDPEPGMEVYDPCCGSAGLLIKCQLVLQEKMELRSKQKYAPLKLYGQEFIGTTWAMANMNMVIHDMEGTIEIGDTMNSPKFKERNKLKKFDLVTANPMWNQDNFNQSTYENDEFERFSAGFPPNGTADWGWVQHILASLKENGRAGIVLDTGAVSRGSGNQSTNREKEIRKWFVEKDLIEGVLYLPENLFYNTSAPGIVLFLNKKKDNLPAGKAGSRKNKILLINASKEFQKGQPKNFIPEENQNKIVDTYLNWKEIEKFSKVIDKDEIVKNDYNLSPTRYIHTAEEETYRPIGEILEDLRELEQEQKEIDRELKNIFKKLGY